MRLIQINVSKKLNMCNNTIVNLFIIHIICKPKEDYHSRSLLSFCSPICTHKSIFVGGQRTAWDQLRSLCLTAFPGRRFCKTKLKTDKWLINWILTISKLKNNKREEKWAMRVKCSVTFDYLFDINYIPSFSFTFSRFTDLYILDHLLLFKIENIVKILII